MATEVSSLVRLRGGYKEEQRRVMGPDAGVEKSTAALITRDLLGGSSNLSESQQLDLDLQVPTGWEKRLDLKSGKIYVQKCSPANSPPIYDFKHHNNAFFPKLQDMNSSPSKITLNLFDETCLEFTADSTQPSSSNYLSVCTLDKVKSALERVEKDPARKRPLSSKSTNSPSYSSPSSSMKELSSPSSVKEFEEDENEEKLFISPVATGCPGCLSYVLVTKNNPRCPRCSTVVPLPSKKKKPRIDLNISI